MPEHPPIDVLMATVLDAWVAAHLEGCVPCRVERDRLRSAMAAELEVPSQDLIGARVRLRSALARESSSVGATVDLLHDGEAALHLRRAGDTWTLFGRIASADEDAVRARFEATKTRVHPCLLAWDTLDVTDEGHGVRCSLPRCERLEQVAPIGPAEIARFAGQAASALSALHAAGLTHGAVPTSTVGVTPTGRILLAPPDLGRAVSEDVDRRGVGELIEAWLELRQTRSPALERLASELIRGSIRSDQDLLRRVLDVWDAVRGGASRYLLGPQLGEGGMGVVFRASDVTMRRDVAMKLQHPSRRDDLHFLREARITASMQHPAVVPVYDLGELADGRVYYTMEEVSGPDLGHAVRALHAASGTAWGETEDGWTLRRLVDVLARVGDSLGLAHSQGLVHCDVKPDNIKLGEHGAVRLMDWGMAARDGDVRRGGTPGYMPLSQAPGHRVDRRSDVFALGRTLCDLLYGIGRRDPADDGPPPPGGLVEIARDCMSDEVDRRPGGGAEVSRRLRDWLDGVQRRDRAERTVQAVARFADEADAVREQAARLRQRAAERLERTHSWEPADKKVAGWRDEEEAATLERDAAVLEARYEQGLRAALQLDAEHAGAREALTDLYKQALLRAERESDARDTARYATFLQHHDDGRSVAWIRGDGALTLHTTPPGAEVLLERYVSVDRRLVTEPVERLGTTPIEGHPVERGSYLLRIQHPDCEEVRYPVHLERGEHWDATPPGASAPEPVRLPERGSLGADDVLVPAGWFWVGGDPEASDPLPRRHLWADAFVVRRFPVTHGAWRAWLDHLVATGRRQEALRRVPSSAGTIEVPVDPLYVLDGERFLPAGDLPDGIPTPDDDRPVNGIDWYSARAFAAWEAERTGEPWRLPHDCEWAKAARGADGRCFPWGDAFDGSFACGGRSFEGMPTLASITDFPVDESPYGVRGLAGNVREWCMNGYARNGPEADRLVPAEASEDEPWRLFRSGGYHLPPMMLRAASRAVARPADRYLATGLRLFRSL